MSIQIEDQGASDSKISETLACQNKKNEKLEVNCNIVTPCFPQFVKLTGLAKNCGKLMNVNM
jgi:hypothetical protein